MLALLATGLCAPYGGARPALAVAATACSRPQGDQLLQVLTAHTHAHATDITMVEDAYECLFAHYPPSPLRTDQVMLQGAMAAMITYLQERGLDQAAAVLPALTGNRDADWRAFRRTFLAVAARLPHTPALQEGLAGAAINGLVSSLQDDHAAYIAPPGVTIGAPGQPQLRLVPGGAHPDRPVLGVTTSFDPAQPNRAPLFLTAVRSGTPAAHAGLRAGDIVMAVDGAPLFNYGLLNAGVKATLDRAPALTLTVRRPSDGHIFTVRLRRSVVHGAGSSPVTARLLPGGIAYISLAQFVPGASDMVFAAIQQLSQGAHLRGVVLDLRGNGGGSADEPTRLLSAFVHHATVTIFDDGHGHRTAQRTDDSIPLLGLPLAILIDGSCFSACEATAAAVHDLHLGRLVGERTGGKVAGPAGTWLLADGGVIRMPVAFMRGPAGEIVDGIGVPPDDQAPRTAAALSAGRDPGIARAVRDLRQ